MNVGVQDRSTAVASPPTVIARRPQPTRQSMRRCV